MSDLREPKRIPGTDMWTSPPVYDDGRYSQPRDYNPETWRGCIHDLVRLGSMVVLLWGAALGALWLLFGLAGSN